jgi:hypothetical protein
MQRMTSFLDPFADPFDTGYQLSQALIAFGRGEWFGVGLGNGIQKQFYLPEAHTDFLLAVLGEEFGLVGVLFGDRPVRLRYLAGLRHRRRRASPQQDVLGLCRPMASGCCSACRPSSTSASTRACCPPRACRCPS